MTELEQELLNIVKNLKEENSALMEVILESQGLLIKELPIAPAVASTGKTPWYIRQRELTRLFKKHREEQSDANKEQ